MSAFSWRADPIAGASSRGAALRRTLALLALLIALGMAAWGGRQALLRWTADLWIVSDPIGPADAVAIFGGGIEDRPLVAAALYRDGLVKKIVISNERPGIAQTLGVTATHMTLTEGILAKLGVPTSDIEVFGEGLSNTHEEALALRAWAERTGARSIIVPTEIFSARRVRWMLHRAFGDDFILRVPAVDPPTYRRDDWWRNVDGLITLQNEVIKYVYYRFRY